VQPPSEVQVPAAREPLWRHVVGDVLRRERLAQERTLKDVADEARISMPYLSELERGRKEASSEVLAAAAHALGLGLADLLALTQGELARLAPARTAEGRAGLTSVTSATSATSQLDVGARRAAAPGDDDAAVMSVAELGRPHAAARSALRRTELCLAA
jgi:transcriptional regulator with XRE-family HTH domain